MCGRGEGEDGGGDGLGTRSSALTCRHIPTLASKEPVARTSSPFGVFGFQAQARMERLWPPEMVE